ncbi:helix-turn-helix transcriptional regulator [Bosea sp. TAF32]|uniref:helix-turn-helix transcriptional regulator n=1 Tax=Bosea sp. TAF32 TaxID=3237482 RepID=UPI003F910FA9
MIHGRTSPGNQQIAKTAGLSIRSLQRKLAAAGLTYSQLVEAARFEKAIELLGTTDAKIIEVAFAAGYSDPAHFARAFRRMAGTTPRRFRNESRMAARSRFGRLV